MSSSTSIKKTKKINISPKEYSAEAAQNLAQNLYLSCLDKNLIITTAESCTGGLASAFITDIAGSSAIFERAFITYSNTAKTDMLNVRESVLKKYGAVSIEVAMAMLNGALKSADADVGIAITGIAGPGGGSQEKPVGTVCFAWGSSEQNQTNTQIFSGNRAQIRLAAVNYAFNQLLEQIKQH